MSKSNRYFLIARDRLTNDFQIIPVTDEYGSSLEEIDSYTTDFLDEKDFQEKLSHKGFSFANPNDFYIVTQVKRGGQNYLNQLEVLYADSRDIQEVADRSLHKRMESSIGVIHQIYNRFFRYLQQRSDFYDFVVFGNTNLYKEFVDSLTDSRYEDLSQVQHGPKRWILESYILIRNVLETESRFRDQYRDLRRDESFRDALKPELMKITHKDYDPNQISFFDFDSLEGDEFDGGEKHPGTR